MVSEKHEVKLKEEAAERANKKLVEEERANIKSSKELEEKNKRIEYLESETDRLRDDRNEHKAYCQQPYEELWETGGIEEHEEAEAGKTEAAEASKAESSDPKLKISRREADKIVVP